LYDESGLPCGTSFIQGNFHHLTVEQADEFTKILVTKLEDFTLVYLRKKASGETLLGSSTSGKGQLSLTPQWIGPLRE